MSLTKQQHSLRPTDIAPSSYGCSELGSTPSWPKYPHLPFTGMGGVSRHPAGLREPRPSPVSPSFIHGEVDRGRGSHGRPREGRPIDVSRPAFPWVETALILDREWPQGTPGIRITTTAPLRAPLRRSRILPGPARNPDPQAQQQPHRAPPPRGAAAHPEMDPVLPVTCVRPWTIGALVLTQSTLL